MSPNGKMFLQIHEENAHENVVSFVQISIKQDRGDLDTSPKMSGINTEGQSLDTSLNYISRNSYKKKTPTARDLIQRRIV